MIACFSYIFLFWKVLRLVHSLFNDSFSLSMFAKQSLMWRNSSFFFLIFPVILFILTEPLYARDHQLSNSSAANPHLCGSQIVFVLLRACINDAIISRRNQQRSDFFPFFLFQGLRFRDICGPRQRGQSAGERTSRARW